MFDQPIFAFIIFAFLSLAFFLVIWALVRTRVDVRRRVMAGSAEAIGGQEDHKWTEQAEKILAPLGEMLRRSPEDLAKERRKLVYAGFRRKKAVFLFYGIRVLLAGFLLLLSVVTGVLWTNPILAVAGSLLLGMAVPDIVLRRMVAKRQRRIQLGLPDMMDLLVICTEAGMGLDQALMRISQEMGNSAPELAQELRLYVLEVNAGKSRAEALRHLSGRTGVDDLKSLASVIHQAQHFGTSIADSLRTFADDLRVKRRQRAEELAAQLSVKIIFPLILFIFPAIFVVVLGPAVIRIFKDFLPGLSN
ncbi:MAG TPA: type II secretion system F family protein [Acidobacteriota bacterium]|nr:type II secretion system F family protein [Acidobacteriota bacterium]